MTLSANRDPKLERSIDRVPPDVWRNIIQLLHRPLAFDETVKIGRFRHVEVHQRDLAACMSVNKIFNHVTAPILYTTCIVHSIPKFAQGVQDLHLPDRISLDKPQCLALVRYLNIERDRSLWDHCPPRHGGANRCRTIRPCFVILTSPNADGIRPLRNVQHVSLNAIDQLPYRRCMRISPGHGVHRYDAVKVARGSYDLFEQDFSRFLGVIAPRSICMRTDGHSPVGEDQIRVPFYNENHCLNDKSGAERNGPTYILHYNEYFPRFNLQNAPTFPHVSPMIWVPAVDRPVSGSNTPCNCANALATSNGTEGWKGICPCWKSWKEQADIVSVAAYDTFMSLESVRRTRPKSTGKYRVKWDIHPPPIPKCLGRDGCCASEEDWPIDEVDSDDDEAESERTKIWEDFPDFDSDSDSDSDEGPAEGEPKSRLTKSKSTLPLGASSLLSTFLLLDDDLRKVMPRRCADEWENGLVYQCKRLKYMWEHGDVINIHNRPYAGEDCPCARVLARPSGGE